MLSRCLTFFERIATITRDTKTINTRLLTKDNYSFDIEECTWLYVWSITPFDKFNPTEMKFLRYKNLMRREIDEKQLCRNWICFFRINLVYDDPSYSNWKETHKNGFLIYDVRYMNMIYDIWNTIHRVRIYKKNSEQ